MRTAIFVGILPFLLAGSPLFAAEPAELAPYSFLVGEWVASGSGQPGTGVGTAVFSRSLQDRVMLRTSYAEYPPADGRPASRHDDLMIIYVSPGGGVRADYYDNEGHVIRYAVQSPAAGQAVFLSESDGTTPRFRLSYHLEPKGVLKGEFAIATPDATEDFHPYLTWQSRQASETGK